ncbi:ATP-binding protein [Dactylosporangium sp. NPDC000555]|uniref:ATP-binding protein n=1 Tax=Dactylosporangium sp. NPDC000555 TaxID=3154260 RepID=UPI00332DC522
MAESAIAVRVDVDLALVQIAAVGAWTWRMRVDLVAAVRKALAERPRAVLLDLKRLADADGAVVAAVLLAERQGTGLDPPVPIVAVASGTIRWRLRTAGVAERVAVYASLTEALAALADGLPPPRRTALRLPPDVLSACAARNHVTDACLAWDLAHLLHPARTIVSELATNAVEHAGTPFTVTVSRRGHLLHLAVEDRDPAPPRTLPWAGEGPSLAPRGAGLRIVSGTAAAWGTAPTAAGKVVWATLGTLDSRQH